MFEFDKQDVATMWDLFSREVAGRALPTEEIVAALERALVAVAVANEALHGGVDAGGYQFRQGRNGTITVSK